MYNQRKITLFKKLGFGLLVIVSIVVGFALGNLGKEKKIEEAKVPEVVQEKPKGLTQGEVNDFLIAYYTKKDLSENRSRYKNKMTEAMYKQEVATEELPVNQAYKGYTVNQVFDKASIYINEKELLVRADVSYHNTLLRERNTTKGAQVNQPNHESIMITFVKEGNKYLVNNIEREMISSIGDNQNSNDYSEDPEAENTEETVEVKGGLK
ncbi:hypothetical protein ACI1TM_08630 [Lactococcus garvieae]|uniref:hypothetical protein n=1 Tax=Lactococcus garvieae TaxID=1363 RepID=UPI003853D641